MILSDIQPHYFPRQHYFARMLASDHFVIRDDVQFVKNHKFPDGTRGVSHQVDTPILTDNGVINLTVFIKKDRYQPINKTRISYDQQWQKKHLNLLRSNYSKSPYYSEIAEQIENILDNRYSSVSELNTTTICWTLCRLMKLEYKDPKQLSLDYVNSKLKFNKIGRLRKVSLGTDVVTNHLNQNETSPSEKIVGICNTLNSGCYITGNTAYNSYLDKTVFADNEIELEVQQWNCSPYSQHTKKQGDFIPNLSVIDLFMNCSPEYAVDYLYN